MEEKPGIVLSSQQRVAIAGRLKALHTMIKHCDSEVVVLQKLLQVNDGHPGSSPATGTATPTGNAGDAGQVSGMSSGSGSSGPLIVGSGVMGTRRISSGCGKIGRQAPVQSGLSIAMAAAAKNGLIKSGDRRAYAPASNASLSLALSAPTPSFVSGGETSTSFDTDDDQVDVSMMFPQPMLRRRRRNVTATGNTDFGPRGSGATTMMTAPPIDPALFRPTFPPSGPGVSPMMMMKMTDRMGLDTDPFGNRRHSISLGNQRGGSRSKMDTSRLFGVEVPLPIVVLVSDPPARVNGVKKLWPEGLTYAEVGDQVKLDRYFMPPMTDDEEEEFFKECGVKDWSQMEEMSTVQVLSIIQMNLMRLQVAYARWPVHAMWMFPRRVFGIVHKAGFADRIEMGRLEIEMSRCASQTIGTWFELVDVVLKCDDRVVKVTNPIVKYDDHYEDDSPDDVVVGGVDGVGRMADMVDIVDPVVNAAANPVDNTPAAQSTFEDFRSPLREILKTVRLKVRTGLDPELGLDSLKQLINRTFPGMWTMIERGGVTVNPVYHRHRFDAYLDRVMIVGLYE